MRITKLVLPTNSFDTSGLEEIIMDKIKPIVLLAGKNGAGKSRFLWKMASYLNSIATEEQANNWQQDIRHKHEQIKKNEEQIQSLQEKTSDTNKEKSQIVEQMNSLQQTNNSYTASITQTESFLKFIRETKFSEIQTKYNVWGAYSVPYPQKIKPVRVEFRDLDFGDISQLSGYEVTANANIPQSFEQLYAMKECVIPIIQSLHDKFYEIEHNGELDIEPNEIEKIRNDYTRLQEYVKIFLGTEITRAKDGSRQVCLFGRKLNDGGWSEGQKVLLLFCLTIYSFEVALEDLIIILDEPENHLHPSALIEVIDKISQHVTNGQLWIATHSVPLLAHFIDNKDAQMWYVENGCVEYLGKNSQKVLQGLLGNEKEHQRMRSFLDLPAEQAFDQFCYECLFEPEVLMTDSNDPQTNQIYQYIGKYIDQKQKIRILDFGAGRGRLISAINTIASNNNKKQDFIEHLDYIAYDITNDLTNEEQQERKKACCEAIDAMYGAYEGRYYNTKAELIAGKGKTSVDIIILCNVFHEIDPTDWLETFSENDIVISMLKHDGHLLVVEDQRLAVGEQAHKYGFLVFDQPQFQTLFAMNGYKYDVQDASKNKDGRLKAHLIAAKYLQNITFDTCGAAIELLSLAAKQEIEKMRNSKKLDYKAGKTYAFWSQQYVNANLALPKFRGKNPY
jgi:predicted ATPase